MKLKNILLLLALGMLFACEPKVDDFTTTAGSADFSNYVALGNSLTAGYTSGDLFKSGQENSYPAMLAYQFEAAGGGEFKQPLMFDEYGFGKRMLLDASIPGPVSAGVDPDERNFTSIAASGPYNNMGVPGAKSYHLIAPNYGVDLTNGNPYFYRFASTPDATVLEDAVAQNATFFTCWIGSNDVLAYAFEGGASDSLTDPALFQMAMGAILQGMTANGAKGAVANIANFEDMPFFKYMNTRVPYNALVLDAEQAGGLNSVYQAIGEAIGYDYGFEFIAGPNAFLVSDKSLPLPAPYNVRQMVPGELFLLTLPTDSLPMGMGSVKPIGASVVPWGIPDQYVLLNYELDEINQTLGAYNETIITLANQFDLALVDMNYNFNEVAGGVEVDGIHFSADYITGNAFSLDGIHLTAQGYVLAANYFIDAINAKYEAGLTHLSPRLYPGIYYYQ